ncbi:MAG: YeiH family putative sulfate export transporter, partial [Tissierellia bacterium]|nr:YeiH family putative sulfate export transporter [Tissierellia bacterium]
MRWLEENSYGLVFSLLIALVAYKLGGMFPLIGGPVFGIVIGIIISNLGLKPEKTRQGITFVSKKILQWAIIFLGAGLNLNLVIKTGMQSLSVTLITLISAFLAAYGFGRLLKVPGDLKTLIGVGTAICGGSAIAAVSPIIEAEENDVAFAISTIFLFNILAALVFPPLGHLLGLSDLGFGLWAGTAINDTSSVVAAAYSFSDEAGAYATIVKLTRTTMIIPISLFFAFRTLSKKRKESTEDQDLSYSLGKIFPWFIVWFLLASLINTLGIFDFLGFSRLSNLAKFMITMALVAVGLSVDFKKMKESGFRPIVLGLIVWIVVALVS